MGLDGGRLQFNVDAKRGTVTAVAPLISGNKVIYSAREFERDRFNKLKAMVSIVFATPKAEYNLAYTALDIRDDKDRTHLANSARKQLTGPKGENSAYTADLEDWSESVNRYLLDEFCRLFPGALLEGQGAKLGTAGEQIKPFDWVIRGWIQRYGGHLLYAPKGAGKTTIAILIQRCIEFGIDLFGKVERPAKCMFLQLERNEETFLRSVQLCNRALGLPVNEPILYRCDRGKSLSSIADGVSRDVDKHGVEVLFTDSISRMSGGASLINDDTSNGIMDTLNGLAPCHYDLAHTSWEGKGDPRKSHVYGSIMFGNAADVVIQLLPQRKHNLMGLMLTIADANAFEPGARAFLALEFDDQGLSLVRKATADEFPDLTGMGQLDTEERLNAYLQDVKLASATDASKALGIERSTVSRYFSKPPFVFVRREGKESMYGLLATGGNV